MTKPTLDPLSRPEPRVGDALHELVRNGSRELAARAMEAELSGPLSRYNDNVLPDWSKAVQLGVKGALHAIRMARMRDFARQAFNQTVGQGRWG